MYLFRIFGIPNFLNCCDVIYNTVNPLINNCLRHALKHLDKYKYRAKQILNFGINYNKRIVSEIDFDKCYIGDELGGLFSIEDDKFKIAIIIVDVEINDYEIKALVDELPKFNKY